MPRYDKKREATNRERDVTDFSKSYKRFGVTQTCKGVLFLAQLHKERRRRIRQLLACVILASLSFALLPSLNATATAPMQSSSPPSFTNWADWQAYVANVPEPQAGCFVAHYPSTVWQPTQCVAAPLVPLTVGNLNDWVAYIAGAEIIGRSKGSFKSVTGLKSETDVCVGPPPFCTKGGQGTNGYSLQVNSQTFATETPYTNGEPLLCISPSNVCAWQQFDFENSPKGFTGIFIQYWLLNYHSWYGDCPSTGPPGGSAWKVNGGDCYADSYALVVPSQPASKLVKLSLAGYAKDSAGHDKVELCVSGGDCYWVVTTPKVLNLYEYWYLSEFNVFGWGNGSQAQFNSGTKITVVNTLTLNGKLEPLCSNMGQTGETNNLNLGSCSSGNTYIQFTESN